MPYSHLRLGLPSDPSGFSTKQATCPTNLILLDLISNDDVHHEISMGILF
jgi:hypothetical protein